MCLVVCSFFAKKSLHFLSLHFVASFSLPLSLTCFHLARLVFVSSDCSTAHKRFCFFMNSMWTIRTVVVVFGFNRRWDFSVFVCTMFLSVTGWCFVEKSQFLKCLPLYFSFTLLSFLSLFLSLRNLLPAFYSDIFRIGFFKFSKVFRGSTIFLNKVSRFELCID